MKNYIFITIFLLSSVYSGYSQCRAFAKTVGVAKLDTILFEHDGRLNSLKLAEGEEIEIFKTISARQSYKIAVCASSELPQELVFAVMDFDRNMLFDNNETGQQSWEFIMDSDQRIIIYVRIPRKTTNNKEKAKGCLSVVLGTKRENAQ